jgi:hypothetical protein
MPSSRRRRAVLAALLAGALVVTACGGDDDEKPRPKATTTTTPAPRDAAPLTGLSQPDAALRTRVALVVKIDNAPKARPQAGVNQADVVIEEKVEDGVTRFFTIFHSADADPVGPVRSSRSTDIELATPLNRPLFSYSGTNATFQQQVDQAPLVDVGINKAAADYHRDRSRPAPYNLFSSTSALFRRAPADSKPPKPLFRYWYGKRRKAAGEAKAGGVHVEFLGDHIDTLVDYQWDAKARVWRRSTDGTPHVDPQGTQVSPRNVVVQFVEYVDTGQRDRSNTVVPEAKLLGEGDVWVLTQGVVVKGRWARASAERATTYTDPKGAPILLTPGQTWVELAPIGQARLT